MLTTDQKGAIVETAIAHEATKLLLPNRVGRRVIALRLAPTQNKQHRLINWADEYDFAATLSRYGAIAQLGERQRGTLEVAGSSPAGSTLFTSIAS
jgi:hypothetical protein